MTKKFSNLKSLWEFTTDLLVIVIAIILPLRITFQYRPNTHLLLLFEGIIFG